MPNAKDSENLEALGSEFAYRTSKNAVPAHSVEPRPKIILYTEDELRRLSPAEMISHTASLQHAYGRLEMDNQLIAREFQEYQDNLAYFSTAAKFARQLSAANTDAISELAIRQLPKYFNCRFAALFFYDPDTELLSLHGSSSPECNPIAAHSREQADHFLIKLFFSNESPYIIECDKERGLIAADNGCMPPAVVPRAWADMLGPRALVMPLRMKHSDMNEPLVLGGLILGDADGEMVAQAAEASVFFAELFSASLYNAMLVQKLSDLAIIEPLTQLFNRRYLLTHLNIAMAQASRYGHCLSIAMFDIDDFKNLNDTYGHVSGDEVLRTAAKIIKSSVRDKIDITARYGGEEFIIVMPCTSGDNAMIVAERLRQAIKRHIFALMGENISITCSVGITEYIANESMESFITRADTALYQAKRSGKDRTCRSAPEAVP